MNNDVEYYIRNNISWFDLPINIKQSLGNSQKEYERKIIKFSIRNQVRFRGNIVRLIKKETTEKRYYEEVINYSINNLLLYPYHLSDLIVKGLRLTPFQYYLKVFESIMEQEKSYDSLPNFTAADCLRLMGIGRNEYIDLMNQCKSFKRSLRPKYCKDLLPTKPITINIEPWWIVDVGGLTEADIKMVSDEEKGAIDKIIDNLSLQAGELDYNIVQSLYKKCLIYLDVPIKETDYFYVPPLEGFVMNRISGDNFETLLYKIFVSIDENTTVKELANILSTDIKAVENAISLYCRLGFAKKKTVDMDGHARWSSSWQLKRPKLLHFGPDPSSFGESPRSPLLTPSFEMKLAFIFDSSLTAFLMGNLCPNLKKHAVTLYEVGKLTDEQMDSFLMELEKVNMAKDQHEGEIRNYFDHACILRSFILKIRRKGRFLNHGMDLIRAESLKKFDKHTLTKLLTKNYSLVILMAPGDLSRLKIPDCLPILGPAIPEINSLWFRLFLYHKSKIGPPSLLLTKGTRVRKLPNFLKKYKSVLLIPWSNEILSTIIPVSSLIIHLNNSLTNHPVLVQGYELDKTQAELKRLAFPISRKVNEEDNNYIKHPVINSLSRIINLNLNCGYIEFLNLTYEPPEKVNKPWEEIIPDLENSLINNLNLPALSNTKYVDEQEASSSKVKMDEPSSGDESLEIEPFIKRAEISISGKMYPTSSSESMRCDTPDEIAILDDVSKFLNRDSPTKNKKACVFFCCKYGIPLFDEKLNEQICNSILDVSLDVGCGLQNYNSKLAKDLNEFINKFKRQPGIETHEIFENNKNDNSWPEVDLLFCNGELKEWNYNVDSY